MKSPTAVAASDAADEFQAAIYCALVGYYRVAFSCLRNVLEQMTIGARLALVPDTNFFRDWRNGSEKIGLGWAADTIRTNAEIRALEKHLHKSISDSLFDQAPKGFVRRLFAELSKYTHGSAGFADADFRQSNGPIFVAETFITWSTAVLKTYIVVLHELKLAHPKLKDLPYGPPEIALDELRRKIVTDIAFDRSRLPVLAGSRELLAVAGLPSGKPNDRQRTRGTRNRKAQRRSPQTGNGECFATPRPSQLRGP